MSRFTIIVILSSLVTSCGGGGGSSVGQANPDPVPPPVQVNPSTLLVFQPLTSAQRNTIRQNYRTQMRFTNQPALGLIKADEAYVNLESSRGGGSSDPARTPTLRPGEGIKIGVIDNGIDLDHTVFEHVSKNAYFANGRKDVGHGTAVISVMASNPQSSLDLMKKFGGIAWGADFTMYTITYPTQPPAPPPYSHEDIEVYYSSPESALNRIVRAFNDGVDFLNMSFSSRGLIDNPKYSETELRKHISPRIQLLAQADRSEKTILVYSAGNANEAVCAVGTVNCVSGKIVASSPHFSNALMVRIAELRSHSVVVVAVDSKGPSAGEISYFSNRCGIAAQWCIAAPGRDIRAAVLGGTTNGNYLGTSFAAPFVTGGLAVMKHIFRGQLSNTALLQRLYATAKKSDIYADSDTYGQGLMDLGAATSPQGQQTLALGNSVDDGGFSLQSSQLKLGMAFGDGFRSGLMNHEIVTFDRLGAPFWHELSAFVQHQRSSRRLSERLHRWDRSMQTRTDEKSILSFATDISGMAAGGHQSAGQLQIGFLRTGHGSGIGPLSLAENAMGFTYAGSSRVSLSAYTTSPIREFQPMTGLALSWRTRSLPLAFRIAWLGEGASILGSETSGAFGRVATHSITAGATTVFDWSDWRLRAEVEIGRSTPQVSGGVITGMSDVWTGGFAVQGSRQIDRNNWVTLGIAQPMRVEKGSLVMSMPVGRTPEGRVLRAQVDADLRPTGRQIDVSVNWRHETSATAGFMLEGVYRRHPGHNAHAPSEFEVTAGWRRLF